MLQDLGGVIAEVRSRISQIPLDVPFYPTDELWNVILNCYSKATSDQVEVVGDTLVVTTPSGNFLTISAQEIPRLWAILPYARALCSYEEKLRFLAKELGYAAPSSGRAKIEIFKKLPSDKWREELALDDVKAIEEAVEKSLQLTTLEQELFLKFLGDSDWSGVSKTLERTDWRQAAIAIAGRWLAVAAERRGELALALRQSNEFEVMMAAEISRAVAEPPKRKETQLQLRHPDQKIGTNELIYGAPGTGKSYSVDEELKGLSVVRTVFHPDMQNSDFFGCLKPTMDGDKVVYAFSPGPFSKALKAAFDQPESHHYLVIEELNRAPAAAVFGELFQLLDRDDNGASRYEVDVPSEDAAAWFGRDKIRLPSNLTLKATMNSADQGVFPLDTAFRRRWIQKYFPLYGDHSVFPDGSVTVATPEGSFPSEWPHFVEVLNDRLIELGTAEDRLMGIWFARESELGGQIPMKVLLYLWDDVLRHQNRQEIFDDKLRTFGALNHALKTKRPVLAGAVLASLQLKAAQVAADNSDGVELSQDSEDETGQTHLTPNADAANPADGL